MRLLVFGVAPLLAATVLLAQRGAYVTESADIAGKKVSITYGAPKVNGRAGKLFGKDGRISQDPNYPIWRAGANAATKLHTDADLEMPGLAVPKGDYTLYVDLSNPSQWQLVINKQTGQWGLEYSRAKDLGRVSMKMSKPGMLVEELKYTLKDEGGNKGLLTLAWENVSASVAFSVK